jgi:hypothetical protein
MITVDLKPDPGSSILDYHGLAGQAVSSVSHP